MLLGPTVCFKYSATCYPHHTHTDVFCLLGVKQRSDRRNLPRAAVFLGGYCRFAAVTAEAFAASRRSWRRSLPLRGGHRGGLFYTDTKTTQKSLHLRLPPFYHRYMLGVCASWRHLRRQQAKFRRNRRGGGAKQAEKSHLHCAPLAVGGGHVAVLLRRAALEVTAVFCGHGRCFFLEVFLGFSIWRLKRSNL